MSRKVVMKMRFYKFSKSNYLVTFVCFTGLNIILVGILLYTVYAQTTDEVLRNQTLLVVEVVKQKDCPVSFTIVNVDNSAPSFQRVNFNVQNISTKAIRAYVLTGQAKTTGKIITDSFITSLLNPGLFQGEEISLERKAIKESGRMFLSVDYIEFQDGSSWGVDSQGFSKRIAGERVGRVAAINRIKDLIARKNLVDLDGLLGQEISEMEIETPDSGQSDEWKKGYRTGYKAVFSILQRSKEGGVEALSTKLNEIEKLVN